MIDFILLVFVLAVFYGGFWTGAKFQTVGALVAAGKSKVKAWLA